MFGSIQCLFFYSQLGLFLVIVLGTDFDHFHVIRKKCFSPPNFCSLLIIVILLFCFALLNHLPAIGQETT